MAKKAKAVAAENDELIVDLDQTFSGEDEVAFEFADDDEGGFFFEADFDAEDDEGKER